MNILCAILRAILPYDSVAGIHRIRRVVFALSLIFASAFQSVHGQSEEDSFLWFPDKMLFLPPVANQDEPRMGLRKEFGSSRLTIEVGSVLDVFQVQVSESSAFSVGVEFFLRALSTGNDRSRLQIQTADGLFGGHIGWKSVLSASEVGGRFRFIHLSGHLVDGSYDPNTGTWINGRDPIPFTRDFAELTIDLSTELADVKVRPYVGGSYATLVRPDSLQSFSALAGVEIHTRVGTLLGVGCTPYFAYHFALQGIPEYVGSNSIEAGMKLGTWGGRGMRLYVNYLSGPDVFTQYFDQFRQSWGAGFTFDVW